jgi:hypothetical protein
MSIWGADPFENDDASDWLSELEDEPSLEMIEEAFLEVIDASDVGYIEIPECCIAIAAAEVLTILFGISDQKLFLEKETVGKLKNELNQLSIKSKKKLVTHSLAALDMILNDEENSELHQIVKENHTLMTSWTLTMDLLENRLKLIFSQLQDNTSANS